MSRRPCVPAAQRRASTILLVSNHGAIIGGGELSLLGLLQGLDCSRFSPVLVVPSEGEVAARASALGVPVRVLSLPTLRRPGPSVLRAVAALRGLVRSSEATLLHANGSRAMIYAGLAGRLSRRPALWHVRVADCDPLLDRLLARLASTIIVNSQAVARRFAWAPSGRVRCIHNGVDLARFSPRQPPPGLRAALGLPDGAPLVACVGRLEPAKGHVHLLEAARRLQESRPGVHWVLVGDGELRGSLEERRRSLGLRAQVHFTGWREDVPDILALCDLFVLPSLAEHFGRVLIEAMAMGKAVVATDAGGVPEIVIPGETGLLVPPGAPGPLAEAVLALLADPALAARLGAAGRRRAEGTFSLAHHVEAVEALYLETLDGNGLGV